MKKEIEVRVENRRLKLSNLQKILYPETGFTKAQIIDYYTRVSPVLLPHLRGRPLTLKRYPDGVDGQFFYEKECPSHRPPWIRTKPVTLEKEERVVNFCLADDLPTLVWVANLASLELHTSLSLAQDIARPTAAVFDLDPGESATIVDCSRVAVSLRELLAELGLQSFPKTSGLKGLQVYLPLNSPVDYEGTKNFAFGLARLLERMKPEMVVSKMAKRLRRGRVFVDWSQNDAHKTTVCAYSLRAWKRPSVSTPVMWEEVEKSTQAADATLLSFHPDQVLERIAKLGDLFAPVLTLRQNLPTL